MINSQKIIRNAFLIVSGIFILSLSSCLYNSPNNVKPYQNIDGFSEKVNKKLSVFLEDTQNKETRKIALFDCDGTILGQVPHYLADEALYSYAKENYEGKEDSLSKSKMQVVDKMLKGNNVEGIYVQQRIQFFSGLTMEQIENIGNDIYKRMYKGKIYPEIKELITNLKNYGFEIWIMTASPEYLYQKFLSEELDIPKNRIIGVKSVVKNGVTTDEMVVPVVQDEGKEEYVNTYIKEAPLLVVGNSRGDMEMMNTSVGLQIIINPDDKKIRSVKDGAMNGYTVKSYWESKGALVGYSNDTRQDDYEYVSEEWGVRANKPNEKQND